MPPEIGKTVEIKFHSAEACYCVILLGARKDVCIRKGKPAMCNYN
jgi:hypothetical protein